MSQHQQAFLARDSKEASQLERLVLSALNAANASLEEPVSPANLRTFENRIYQTCIAEDSKPFFQTLDVFQKQKHDVETLAQILIPDVARRLGAAWVMDELSFADVTIGCARLQNALRDLPLSLPISGQTKQMSCLVLVPEGTQHTLGAFVLSRLLRNAGLDVMLHLNATQQKLYELVEIYNFDIVSISASRGDEPGKVGQLIKLSRALWPDCKTVAGGTICDAEKNNMRKIGADLVTSDPQKVIDLCN